MKAVGFVPDVSEFFAACDAFVVSAPFEPLGMVALEAAACGVPVVAGEGVGALPTLLQYGCGIAWPQGDALEPLVRRAMDARIAMNAGAQRMCAELGEQNYAKRLLALCEVARNRNHTREGK
jgi:glycosyltransferase involved in cell wall biosynthesis